MTHNCWLYQTWYNFLNILIKSKLVPLVPGLLWQIVFNATQRWLGGWSDGNCEESEQRERYHGKVFAKLIKKLITTNCKTSLSCQYIASTAMSWNTIKCDLNALFWLCWMFEFSNAAKYKQTTQIKLLPTQAKHNCSGVWRWWTNGANSGGGGCL